MSAGRLNCLSSLDEPLFRRRLVDGGDCLPEGCDASFAAMKRSLSVMKRRVRGRFTLRGGGHVPHCYRFGRVEVRPAERLLLVDGHSVVLGSRAFDMLIALVEHRDRLVTKSELLDLAWPGLVVEENNLAVQVVALRKALGPQAIATVPGRGYRFAMALDDAPAAAAAPAPTAEPSVAAVPPLPVPASSLLGRDDDLAALDPLLQTSRLVTIVGAGGIGKTSLALAVAHARRPAHRDGAAWVDLAQITDPALVAAAAAQAVGLPLSGRDDPLPALVEAFKPMKILLVLDNAEHLLPAVQRFVTALRSSAAGVTLLVTSQAALKLDGERLFRLGPLSVPDAGTAADVALAHGAVALFVDRAQAADRRFALTGANVDAVSGLCRQLDGMALAIKLAAARLPLLGIDGLSARLGDRLRLLSGGGPDVPTRQQTLRAALEWSCGLLGTVEQTVFRRLGVFVGGFALEHACAVAGGDGLDDWAVIDALGELVDRSLVAANAAETPRYRLLESAREFACLKLDASAERDAIQRRHAEATVSMMEAGYEAHWAMADKPWLDAYGAEIDNVRAALEWSMQHAPELAIRLAGASGFLFLLSGQAGEARRRFAALEPAAAACKADGPVSRYWLERARFSWGVSHTLMREHALEAVRRYRLAGDTRGLYLALRCAAAPGVVAGNDTDAMLAEMTALENPGWPPRLRAQRLLAEVSVLQRSGRLVEAHAALDRFLPFATAAGLDAFVLVALSGLARIHLALGDLGQAMRCARDLVSAPGARRGNFVLHGLGTIAEALLLQGQVGEARSTIAGLVAESRRRDWEWFGSYGDVFALLAAREGRVDAAARLIGYAAAFEGVDERDPRSPARTTARAAVEAVLDATALQRLTAEGSRLDIEAVCRLTLA
jgi:predicted ATPase/DNA-binding winged helix-turn-helix (wHTH) protein